MRNACSTQQVFHWGSLEKFQTAKLRRGCPDVTRDGSSAGIIPDYCDLTTGSAFRETGQRPTRGRWWPQIAAAKVALIEEAGAWKSAHGLDVPCLWSRSHIAHGVIISARGTALGRRQSPWRSGRDQTAAGHVSGAWSSLASSSVCTARALLPTMPEKAAIFV